MQTLTELILGSDFRGRVFSEREIGWLIEGSAQRRYNLVNRALKAGEVIRLARGVYILNPEISGVRPHSFVVAQALRPGSFVSFETALAWHDCIPEGVRQIRCTVSGRRKVSFDLPSYGEYRFVPMPVVPGRLLAGVSRKRLTAGTALIADPLRALLDLVCSRKVEPEALFEFLGGLRLDEGWMRALGMADVHRFRGVFRFRRMEEVIENLARGLMP